MVPFVTIHSLTKSLSLQFDVTLQCCLSLLRATGNQPGLTNVNSCHTRDGKCQSPIPPCHTRDGCAQESLVEDVNLHHILLTNPSCLISSGLLQGLLRALFGMQGVVLVPNQQQRTLQRALVGSTITAAMEGFPCTRGKRFFYLLLSVLKTVFHTSPITGAGKRGILQCCTSNGHKGVCRRHQLVPTISSYGVAFLVFATPARYLWLCKITSKPLL